MSRGLNPGERKRPGEKAAVRCRDLTPSIGLPPPKQGWGNLRSGEILTLVQLPRTSMRPRILAWLALLAITCTCWNLHAQEFSFLAGAMNTPDVKPNGNGYSWQID